MMAKDGISEDCKNLIEYVRLFTFKPLTVREVHELERFYTENKLLTPKQARFCHYYDLHRNKLKAYKLTYNCSVKSANANVHRLFKNENVLTFIKALNQRTGCLVIRYMTFSREADRLGLSKKDRHLGSEILNDDLNDM